MRPGRNQPHDDRAEAIGIGLAEAYRKALLARAEFEDRFDQPDATVEGLAILLDYFDARDDLIAHLERHGRVETEGGIYRLNALGTLSFVHAGRVVCR